MHKYNTIDLKILTGKQFTDINVQDAEKHCLSLCKNDLKCAVFMFHIDTVNDDENGQIRDVSCKFYKSQNIDQ